MDQSLFIEAAREGFCLSFNYHGFLRVAEVHAVGYTGDGRSIALVWQVSGESESGKLEWKNVLLAEVSGAKLTPTQSNAPRPGYNGGGRGMAQVLFEL